MSIYHANAEYLVPEQADGGHIGSLIACIATSFHDKHLTDIAENATRIKMYLILDVDDGDDNET